MQENKDWLMFANIAILKTRLKWIAFTFSRNYKKQVFQASIRNCLFLGKNKAFFFSTKNRFCQAGVKDFIIWKIAFLKNMKIFWMAHVNGSQWWETDRVWHTLPGLTSKKWNLGQKIFWEKFNFFGWDRWGVPGRSISHISHYFHQFFHN